MSTLDPITRHIHHLPMLSPVISRLIHLFGGPDHSLQDVSQLVEIDPNLTLNVLRSANAAAHSPGREITSIHQAVVRIGEERIFSIVLKACAGDIMLHSLEGYSAKEGELWRHSLMTAFLAKEITNLNGNPQDASLHYTAGLLHDIGKAVLDHFLKAPLFEKGTHIEPEQVLQTEEERLGVNHAEAGAMLAEHWGLPNQICEAIRYHHNPTASSDTERSILDCLYTADNLSYGEGVGNQLSGLKEKIDITPEFLSSRNLNEEQHQAILDRAYQAFEASEKLIHGS